MSMEKVVALIIVIVILAIAIMFMAGENGPMGWINGLIVFLNSTTDSMVAVN